MTDGSPCVIEFVATKPIQLFCLVYSVTFLNQQVA